jgi:hypothetical protein
MKKSLLLTLSLIPLFILAGCSQPSVQPSIEEESSSEEGIIAGDGDGGLTIEFPDFTSAGEDGEITSAAWDAFAEIADNSKFKLLEEGGYEYFGMYDEPYIMLYDPKFPAGDRWVVYFDENSGNVSVGYDVFEMAPYNAGVELYLYGDIADRPISGAGVSLNPDGSYSVAVKDQGYYFRYLVEDGLISGRGVWDESSATFLGYSSIEYGLSSELKTLVADAYKFAVDAGEDFAIPAGSQIIEEAPQG